jgi:two-component system chemotaxis response regulator CheY
MRYSVDLAESVLIVDDSPSIRAQLRQYFQTLGHPVVAEASNGIEAIDAYVRYKPQWMTLDLVMPQLDGLSALREILRYDPKAKVVIISSSFSQKIRSEAEELGVILLLNKPVSLSQIEEATQFLRTSQEKEKKHG